MGLTNKDKLILWLAGSGFNEAKTTEILANKRVVWELEQSPVDALGLLESLSSVDFNLWPKSAKEKLDFLIIFNN